MEVKEFNEKLTEIYNLLDYLFLNIPNLERKEKIIQIEEILLKMKIIGDVIEK